MPQTEQKRCFALCVLKVSVQRERRAKGGRQRCGATRSAEAA
jgi:hypothetical protein